ncbi:hypothetical protein [Siphonobacter sp. BAB-5385]|nr:hypothetical protein [Siphonobacter sp. BAB-5385]
MQTGVFLLQGLVHRLQSFDFSQQCLNGNQVYAIEIRLINRFIFANGS